MGGNVSPSIGSIVISIAASLFQVGLRQFGDVAITFRVGEGEGLVSSVRIGLDRRRVLAELRRAERKTHARDRLARPLLPDEAADVDQFHKGDDELGLAHRPGLRDDPAEVSDTSSPRAPASRTGAVRSPERGSEPPLAIRDDPGLALRYEPCQVTAFLGEGQERHGQVPDRGHVIGRHAALDGHRRSKPKGLVRLEAEMSVEILGPERFRPDLDAANPVERGTDQGRPPIGIGADRELVGKFPGQGGEPFIEPVQGDFGPGDRLALGIDHAEGCRGGFSERQRDGPGRIETEGLDIVPRDDRRQLLARLVSPECAQPR